MAQAPQGRWFLYEEPPICLSLGAYAPFLTSEMTGSLGFSALDPGGWRPRSKAGVSRRDRIESSEKC